MTKRFLTVMVAAALFAVPALAQTTGVVGINDMTINGGGSGGTSPVDAGLTTTDSQVAIGITASPGEGVFVAYDPAGGCAPGGFLLGGIYTVDISLADIQFLIDGTQVFGGFPVSNIVDGSGAWAFNFPVDLSSAGGLAYAMQTALVSPAGGKIVTQAYCGSVVDCGMVSTSYTLPDDGNTNHVLAAPVNFYGTAHASLFIGSNGQVTFNNGTTDFTETEAEFFDGLGGGNGTPGVGVVYSDLNRGGLTSGATYDVIEDPCGAGVTVAFNNQNHWSSQDPAGSFSCNFSGNTVTLDYTSYIPALTNTDDSIFGVSDGDNGVGADVSLSNGLGTGTSAVQGGYLSSGPGESICETLPANTAHGSPIYIYDDPTGTGTFGIF